MTQGLIACDGFLQSADLLLHRLGRFRVVPEGGMGGFLLEFTEFLRLVG
jgi:hypothetical protein